MARTPGTIDLLVAVDRDHATPLRDQIADQIRAAVRERRLRAGVRLPATRRLAVDLGISRGVVVEAYAELACQGFIVAGGRASPRVAELPSVAAQMLAPTTMAAGGPAPASAAAGVPAPATTALSYRFDLAPEVPDMSLFPRREWLRALDFALGAAPDQTLDYGDPRGALELRQALADYLGRVRGVVTDPDCIVVCQGSIQAIDLACRTLAAAGARTIGVEDPCALGVRHACRYAGLSMLNAPVDRDGLDVESIASVAPDAAVVSPVHQFPTGAALERGRRRRLLEWAQATGATLIEDDYDAEYTYDGQAPPALQGSAAGSVIYVGSASKALAPAIRLGWAVLPRHLMRSAGELKAAMDGGSPAVEQIALSRMIGRAVYEHHVRRVRVEYARRREAALAALSRRLPETAVTGASGGLHFAVQLGAPVQRAAVEARAEARRIRLRTMESFLARQPEQASTLLIGYGRLPVPAAAPAVDALAGLLAAA
jgi:GntR family transcriptional regulator / MocR family aminotransferase